MRIILKEDTVKVLKAFQTQLKAFNVNLETEASPFLNRLICALERHLKEKQIKTLAHQLTSSSYIQKRKQLLLKRITKEMDHALFNELEKQFPEAKNAVKTDEF